MKFRNQVNYILTNYYYEICLISIKMISRNKYWHMKFNVLNVLAHFL